MAHEVAIAAEIQAQLLPKNIPQLPGFEMMAYYRPSLDVGGDYYDFLQIDKDHIGLVVADVSGKGIPGALVMVNARAYFRSIASRYINPVEVAVQLNRLLYQDIPRGMFVTMFYCVLDLNSKIFNCVSLGHNPLVLWRADTKNCHTVNPEGMALGFAKGPIFESCLKPQSVQLKLGDRLVIYTDGIVESMNHEKQLYGSQRFYREVKEYADFESSEFVGKIVKSVEEHQGKALQHDDITLVTTRVVAESGSINPRSIVA